METQKNNPWLIAFRVIFTIALLACIAYIFRNSLQTGAQSSLRSQEAMQTVNGVLGRFHLGPIAEHTIRKIAHFLEFSMEGFLLMLCLRVYTAHFVRHMSWPLLIGMSTAVMDETIQVFVPNRTSLVTDIWIDMMGVVAGLIVALIILLIVRACMAFARIEGENRALRAEREELRRARQEAEHERLAERAAHRAYEAQFGQRERNADDEENANEEEESE